MSHFAQLDENNIVIQVLVGDNSFEDEGYSWFVENIGGRWVKTSYNTRGGKHIHGGTPFRKNYGAEGYLYDEERDAFIPPKPYSSWILNEETCLWEPPIPYPQTRAKFLWNEETMSWERLLFVN